MKKNKLAILTSHPIQYQAPLFKTLARDPYIDCMVYFCWDFGVDKKSFDSEFKEYVQWDIPLLEGYAYQFLKNYAPQPSSGFWGQINFAIIREVWSNKYDAIIVMGWNSFTNIMAMGTAWVRGTPVMIRGENPMNQELLKSGTKRRIKKIVLGMLFRNASIMLCIGEENKKFYEYYGVPSKKLIMCRYAVDNERIVHAVEESRKERKATREKMGIKEDDVVVLFVGKLIEKKNPLDALIAYAQIQNKNKALIIVGEGELRTAIEQYVKEYKVPNVHCTGFKNQTELPLYYACADIFVLPSGSGETWGLVVNEAMCAKLPIIVSDLVGCGADLVNHGENGFIVGTHNKKELTERLEDLINDPVKRAIFKKKSFEKIRGYCYEENKIAVKKALDIVTLRAMR